LKKTLELCTASVFGILEASFKAANTKSGSLIELKIIDTQQELVTPSYSFKAEKITA
jgi:pyridoxal/pyridoxine/pyridoxamine kinase